MKQNIKGSVGAAFAALALVNAAFSGASAKSSSPAKIMDLSSIACSYFQGGSGWVTWTCYSKGDPEGTEEDASCGQCDTYVEGGGCVAPKSANSCCYEINC